MTFPELKSVIGKQLAKQGSFRRGDQIVLDIPDAVSDKEVIEALEEFPGFEELSARRVPIH